MNEQVTAGSPARTVDEAAALLDVVDAFLAAGRQREHELRAVTALLTLDVTEADLGGVRRLVERDHVLAQRVSGGIPRQARRPATATAGSVSQSLERIHLRRVAVLNLAHETLLLNRAGLPSI